MFIPLPKEFQVTGKFNIQAIERYWPDEVKAAAGRFRLIIELTSNKAFTAAFETREDRDRVYKQLDLFLTGRHKFLEYDVLEEDMV